MTRRAAIGLATVGFVVVGIGAAMLRHPRAGGATTPPGVHAVILEPGHTAAMAPRIERLSVHPRRSTWLLAQGPGRATFVTRDRGRSWSPVLLEEPWPGRALRLSDVPPRWNADGRLDAALSGVPWASGDGGVTFARVALEETPAPLPPPAAELSTDGGTWIVQDGVPAFRAEGTRRFEARMEGLAQPIPVQLLQHPMHADWVALVDGAGRVWASTDFGDAWAQQPIDGVLQATWLVPDEVPAWLVRHAGLRFSLIRGQAVVGLGPTEVELHRLVVPPYVERAGDRRHQRAMFARLVRDPTVADAGFDADGALWLHLDGIDVERTRWERGIDGSWASMPRPERVRHIVGWGEAARHACAVAIQEGVPFVGGHEVPEGPTSIGRALQLAFASDDTLFVAGELGVARVEIAAGCTPAATPEVWSWTDPPLREARLAIDAHELRLLGANERGLWRMRIPTTAGGVAAR